VGRADALARVTASLRRGARLVTIAGTAGVGKTRLAAQVAAAHPAGMWFCDLAAARTRDDFLSTLARLLPTAAGPARREDDPGQRLGRWLAGRAGDLVVLDNLEQVVDAAGHAIAAWTATAGAALLVTSRQPLGIDGEIVEPLAPLPVPAPSETEHDEPVADNEAVQLFLNAMEAPVGRRRAVRRAISSPPGSTEAELVADIVRRLEGLPLAIELAAARLEVLTVPQLHERLRDRFRVLADPTHRAERHGRLWNAIDWSWQLLPREEQTVLAQASVFVGGFTLSAAEVVLRLPAEQQVSVLDALQALVRKSLLRVDATARTPRFSLMESIREYAAGRLTATGDRSAAARHAEHYLAQGTGWAEAVDGPRGLEMLGLLASEHDNLAEVLRGALAADPPAPRDVTTSLRAALAITQILSTRGAMTESLRVLDEVVAFADGHPSDDDRRPLGWALRCRALAHRYRGDMDRARTDLVRALVLARGSRDRALECATLGTLGNLSQLELRTEEAGRAYAEALAIARTEGLRRQEGVMLAAIGLWALDAGDFAQAEASCRQALVILREVGDRRFEGTVLGQLATICSEQGRTDEARTVAEQALAVHREVGNRRFEATIVGMLGILDHQAGRLDEARAHYFQTLEAIREVDDRRYEAYFLSYLGRLDLEEGRLEDGERRLAEALPILRAVGDPRYEAIVLSAQVCAAALGGRVEEAARREEEAARAHSATGDPLLARMSEVGAAIGELVQAEAADRASDAARASELVASARARRLGLEGIRSDDVRLAARLLDRALSAADERARAWRVATDGTWFHAPGAARVDLASRKVLTRLLQALAERRLRAPGEPCALPELVEAGWPGTKLIPASAQNRVHVAVSTLRSAGLAPILTRQRGGYCLDPTVPLRVE
jgi:predicted ATPase